MNQQIVLERPVVGKYVVERSLDPEKPIWLAEDLENGEPVVLKCENPERFEGVPQPVLLAKVALSREFDIAQSFDDRRVVDAYEVFEHEGKHYLVQSYGGPATLHDVDVSSGAVGPLAAQIASGLAHIHERGFVHRDIKPGNVAVGVYNEGDGNRSLESTIIDLELAIRPEEHKPIRGSSCGTEGYMSPQQSVGVKTAFSDDVFSFAATVYFMSRGRYPYPVDLKGDADYSKPMFSEKLMRGMGYFGRLIADSLDLDPDKRPEMEELAYAANSTFGNTYIVTSNS